ncbi:MAG: alpha/beta fold hydrolase, partial [Candidatus Hodarchaeota archaeon]
MSIHIEERGFGNPGPVIFVHGAGGSTATWFMQLKFLSRNLHVVTLDLNGHGTSPDRKEKNAFQSYLDDIESVVSKFEQPILSGHSMGGALTQLYAMEKPERLKGIILIGTGARLRVNPMIFDLLENNFDGYVEAMGQFM